MDLLLMCLEFFKTGLLSVGGGLATLFLVLPSIVVILIVARFLHRFQTSKAVQRVLSGLRPASVGLITAAGFGIFKIALNFSGNLGFWECISWKALAVMVAIGVLYHFKQKWHPIIFIALGAVAGLVLEL